MNPRASSGSRDLSDPLEDDEIDWLGEFLLDRVDEDEYQDGMDGGVWDMSTLDGLLTAVVSGPVTIMPSLWMSAVWGDFEPVWDSMADAERVFGLMMRHMNSIARHLSEDPETFEPLFYEREVKGKTYTVVDEWCEGYRRGVELISDEWAEGGAEIAALLEPINGFTEASEWPAHELDQDATEAMQRAIPPNVRTIHAYWLARRGDAPPAFGPTPHSEPIRRAEPRVGRNDPCPCGSGKKYKKCCLQ
jgi:uncharacterized protein